MTEKELKAQGRIFKKDFEQLFKSLKSEISDEYRAYEMTEQEEKDSLPSMSVTIGSNDDLSSWGYQTGDNSFTGGAYGYPNWAVVDLYRRSNSKQLAQEAFEQLIENIETDDNE